MSCRVSVYFHGKSCLNHFTNCCYCDVSQEVTAELQKSHDLVKSKEESLADYESRMSALNEEKCRISSDVQNIQVQVKNMMQSKQELTSQLKEAGFQVRMYTS